jgi:acyl dehydratase
VGGDGAALGAAGVSALAGLVGRELGPTAWLEVTQERIDAFAAATGDPQWIHTDPARAAEGPFGTTIAHGFLTLSLCVPMLYELLPPSGRLVVNYGVNRVRFPAPVPSGSRVRGRFRVLSVEEAPLGERATIEATVECDRAAKPVCVAELVVLTVS